MSDVMENYLSDKMEFVRGQMVENILKQTASGNEYYTGYLMALFDTWLHLDKLKKMSAQQEQINKIGILDRIEVLGFTNRTDRYLMADNIYTIGDLIKYSIDDLYRLPNLGRKSIKEIQDTLSIYGFSLKDS